MKKMRIVLLGFCAFISLGLVGCISHTRERVIEERDRPTGVVIEREAPPRDTTINVNR